MKKKNNRNKLPLVLAALLTLSLVVYGSFAYFTSSTQQKAGMQLTLGNVEVSSTSGNWIYDSSNGPNSQLTVNKQGFSAISQGNDLKSPVAEIENVRPGDKFTKVFTFTNNSTLDAKIKINNGIEDKAGDAFKVTAQIVGSEVTEPLNSFLTGVKKEEDILSDINQQNSFLLTPRDKSVNIQLTVEVGKDHSEYSADPLDLLEKAITIEAVQENYADEHFSNQ